jgi:hypothetical protein
MRQFVIDSYIGVMNAKYNPLRHIPNEDARHFLMLGFNLFSFSFPVRPVGHGWGLQNGNLL